MTKRRDEPSAADVAAMVRRIPQEFERGVAVKSLRDWPGNPKAHDVDAIVESMRINGAYGAVFAQKSTRRILKGHGTRKALRALRVTHVDVLWLDVDERTGARIVAADNNTSTRGGYDDDALAKYLKTLQDDDNLAGSSYDADDVAAAARAATIDDAPPSPGTNANGDDDDDDDDTTTLIDPPANPASKRGVVYQLGRHRVLCGDSTNPGHVALLLGDVVPDVLLTDPPYCSGGFQEAGKRAGSVGTRGTEMVANDTLSTRGYQALMRATLENYRAGVSYVFTDWRMWVNLFDVVESQGYGVRNMIVWDKMTPGMGAGWRMQHELIMCGVRVRSPFNPRKAQGNVMRFKRSGNIYHATEKPVDLVAQILTVTDKARTVADAMGGSGTTLLAAERTGRTAYIMELKPHYTDVIRQRYADMMGDATLAPRGQLSPSDPK